MTKKAIIALGNNGDQYTWTRHNFGWLVADAIAQDLQEPFKVRQTYAVSRGFWNDCSVFVVKPLTFMNLSGQPLKQFIKHEKIELENLLVICDDVDLEFGHIKVRPSGGTGGHRGLKSIVEELGSSEFSRLRLGVGRGQHDMVNHVLGRFTKQERELLPPIIEKAVQVSKDFLVLDWQALMAKYNARPH